MIFQIRGGVGGSLIFFLFSLVFLLLFKRVLSLTNTLSQPIGTCGFTDIVKFLFPWHFGLMTHRKNIHVWIVSQDNNLILCFWQSYLEFLKAFKRQQYHSHLLIKLSSPWCLSLFGFSQRTEQILSMYHYSETKGSTFTSRSGSLVCKYMLRSSFHRNIIVLMV